MWIRFREPSEGHHHLSRSRDDRPGLGYIVARTETRVTVEDRELTLSNLGKVLFPESGFTKGQLIDYYVNVAPAMLPQ